MYNKNIVIIQGFNHICFEAQSAKSIFNSLHIYSDLSVYTSIFLITLAIFNASCDS